MKIRKQSILLRLAITKDVSVCNGYELGPPCTHTTNGSSVRRLGETSRYHTGARCLPPSNIYNYQTAQAANGDSLAPAIVDMMAAVSAQHEPVAEAAIAR